MRHVASNVAVQLNVYLQPKMQEGRSTKEAQQEAKQISQVSHENQDGALATGEWQPSKSSVVPA